MKITNLKAVLMLAALLVMGVGCDPAGNELPDTDTQDPPVAAAPAPEPEPSDDNCPSVNADPGSVPFGGACASDSDCQDGMPCCTEPSCESRCTCV